MCDVDELECGVKKVVLNPFAHGHAKSSNMDDGEGRPLQLFDLLLLLDLFNCLMLFNTTFLKAHLKAY